MKGHVKLELFDAKTGELVESAEGDNLVTNAIKYVIGMYMQSENSSGYFYPIYNKVLGGLMLFDNTLTASVDNVLFPVEAHFVAGARRSTNSTNSMAGSYNSLESEFVNGGNGFKSVWDFSTAQANGTIKSLALTYNNNYDYYYSLYDVFHSLSYGCHLGRNISGQNYSILGIRNGYVYRYMVYGHHTETVTEGSRTSTITIRYIRIVRSKVNITQHGVADAGIDSNLSNAYEAEIVADFDATVWKSETSTNYYYIEALYNDHCGYLYGIQNAKNASGQSISQTYEVWKIAYDSWTIEKSIVTAIDVLYSMRYFYNGYGYIHYSHDKGKIWKTDLATGERTYVQIPVDASRIYDVTIQHIADNGLMYGYVNYYYIPGDTSNYKRCGFLYYPDGTFLWNTDSSIDDTPNEFYPGRIADKLVDTGSIASGQYLKCRINFLGNYLGTIFNLSSAVTKTSSRTMKVSYTLTN